MVKQVVLPQPKIALATKEGVTSPDRAAHALFVARRTRFVDTHEIPADAACDAGCGVLDGGACEMGVASGGLAACGAEISRPQKPHIRCLKQDFLGDSRFRALSRAKIDRKRNISIDESSCGAGSWEPAS